MTDKKEKKPSCPEVNEKLVPPSLEERVRILDQEIDCSFDGEGCASKFVEVVERLCPQAGERARQLFRVAVSRSERNWYTALLVMVSLQKKK